MEIHSDFSELLTLLNSHKVEYLIVGGYALAFYGAPRFTGDIDILVKPNKSNSKKIILVLDQFGFSELGLTELDFQEPDQIIQLGVPPVRVDFLTSISGVTNEELFKYSISGNYGNLTTNFINRDLLIQNKKATGRSKDIADIKALGAKKK